MFLQHRSPTGSGNGRGGDEPSVSSRPLVPTGETSNRLLQQLQLQRIERYSGIGGEGHSPSMDMDDEMATMRDLVKIGSNSDR